jgi:hypothetical protein
MKLTVNETLWGEEFWDDGYNAIKVGKRGNWDTVEKYVKKG